MCVCHYESRRDIHHVHNESRRDIHLIIPNSYSDLSEHNNTRRAKCQGARAENLDETPIFS